MLLEAENPPDLVNLGSGEELSIGELAEIVAETVGFKGRIVHDTSKPDGTPRKLCDTSYLHSTGWKPKYGIRSGVKNAYECFLKELAEIESESSLKYAGIIRLIFPAKRLERSGYSFLA